VFGLWWPQLLWDYFMTVASQLGGGGS
jgi:hypothetical protein